MGPLVFVGAAAAVGAVLLGQVENAGLELWLIKAAAVVELLAVLGTIKANSPEGNREGINCTPPIRMPVAELLFKSCGKLENKDPLLATVRGGKLLALAKKFVEAPVR